MTRKLAEKRAVGVPYKESLTIELVKASDRMIHLGRGDYVPVFSGMLRALARQVEICNTKNMPLECVAGACRIAFEIWLSTAEMLKNPYLISEYEARRWYADLDIVDNFEKLNKPRRAFWVSARKQLIKDYIRDHELRRPVMAKESVHHRAKRLKLGKHYNAMYSLLSQNCHASPLLCDNQPQEFYIDLMKKMTSVYARQTLEGMRKNLRNPSAAFLKLDASGKTGRGTDSTHAISEDREDRV